MRFCFWVLPSLLIPSLQAANEFDLGQETQEVVRSYDYLLVGSTLALIMLLTGTIFQLLRFCRRKTQHSEAIYDALTVQFGMIDRTHRILFLHGYGDCPKEMAAFARTAQFSDETLALWSEKMETAFQTGQPQELEYCAGDHHCRCRINLAPEKEFRCRTAIWTTQEIDDLYLAKLRANDEIRRRAIILSAVAEGVISIDRQENISELNPAAAAICGWKREDAIGRNLTEMLQLTNHLGAPVELPTRQALATQQQIRLTDDCRLHRADGTETEVSVSASPMRDQSGTLPGAVLVLHDITKQNRTQNRIRFDNAILTQTADLGKLSYFQCDRQGQITMYRGNAANWPKRAEDGKYLSQEAWIAPNSLADFRRSWNAVIAGEEPELDTEYHAGLAGEEMHMFRMRMLPEYDKDGEFASFAGIIQDISDISKLTGASIRMLEQLKAFNDCLENIIRSTSNQDPMQNSLKKVAAYYSADRCYLVLFDETREKISAMEEWNGPGIPPRAGALVGSALAQLGESVNWLGERRVLELPTPDFANDRALQNFLQEQGILSMLAAGIWLNGKLAGMIGVERIGTTKHFGEYDRQGIESAASVATLILERRERLRTESIRTKIIRSVIDSGWNPILIFDAGGKLERANKAACELAGCNESELIRTDCRDLLQFGAAATPNQPVQRCITEGRAENAEMTHNGRTFHIIAQPVLDGNGKLLSVVENAFDITQIQQMREELATALKAAEKAESARSTFLNNVAHELRTPLNAVIGFSELLQTTQQESNKQQEYLTAINNAGRSLLALINDIIDLSQLRSGNIQLTPEKTDVTELIHEVAGTFQDQATRKQLKIEVDLPPFVPMLMVDGGRLRQILVNLLGNAVKFTDAGHVDVIADFYVTDRRSGRGQLKLQVKDTGSGISPEMQEKIWEAFVRAEPPSPNRQSGSGGGLGLPIVKRLLEAMRGSVQLESRVGEGSTFTVFLNDLEFVGMAMPLPELQPQTSRKAEADHLVLVVEDIEMNMKLICAMLTRLQLNFVTARSAKAALEIIGNRDISLVLTDVWMPNMTGEEMASLLAENPATAAIPIVAITADTQVKRGLFREVLYKPITLDRLTAVIDRIMPARNP